MNDYVLTCCSTVDLSAQHLEKRGISWLSFHYTLGGKEYPDDMGATMSYKEFYGRLANGEQAVTSQVNADQFYEFFSSFLKQGKDVLHVSFSSGLSGSWNSACIAREQLKKDFPNNRVEIIDSLGASSGYGLLMELMADRRDAGMSFEELRDWGEAHKLTIHHWFFSTDLTSYVRGGRITRAAGWFGTLLHICPLLNMDAAGHLIPREKIRTKQRVIRAIVQKMVEHAQGGTDYSGKCFISNSDCIEDAREVADMVEATFPKLNGKVVINSVGTVIGSHTGIGTVALFFEGDERDDVVMV